MHFASAGALVASRLDKARPYRLLLPLLHLLTSPEYSISEIMEQPMIPFHHYILQGYTLHNNDCLTS